MNNRHKVEIQFGEYKLVFEVGRDPGDIAILIIRIGESFYLYKDKVSMFTIFEIKILEFYFSIRID